LALTPGSRFGPYQIISALGAGGIGEVWRARDTKLDRDVAVKILPEVFADDAERLARFQREAKTLASLNHRHIAAICGFEESNDVTALVMELVEGEDLSQRIARGAIPLDEAGQPSPLPEIHRRTRQDIYRTGGGAVADTAGRRRPVEISQPKRSCGSPYS